MTSAARLNDEVNMADVARRAGVSIATVSRALRDVPGVSEPTRARIREIADELSYVVSPEASRLSSRSTGRVAVVVPKIDMWFYSTMLAGIESVLRDADLDVLVYQVAGQAQRSRFFQHLPARRKVDAVVLIALPLLREEEERLDLMGVEVVVAGGRLRDYPHVEVDDHALTRKALDHLLDLGHRRIAMIRTSDTEGAVWSADLIRTQTYRDVLESRRIPVREDYLVTMPFGYDAGARAMTELLALAEPPTAIFAYSDEIALSALSVLRSRGIAVPEQMSIIGVDGHPMAELYGLSTVSQSVLEQGQLAGRMVLELVRGRPLAESSAVVASELQLRGSTGPPAG